MKVKIKIKILMYRWGCAGEYLVNFQNKKSIYTLHEWIQNLSLGHTIITFNVKMILFFIIRFFQVLYNPYAVLDCLGKSLDVKTRFFLDKSRTAWARHNGDKCHTKKKKKNKMKQKTTKKKKNKQQQNTKQQNKQTPISIFLFIES